MNYSVDTNIFLRFLQRDDPEKTQRVKKVFKQAQVGKRHLIVELFTIIELAYALSSYFKLPKNEICQKLRSILSLSFLDIPDRKELSEAIDVYENHGVDFMDALLFVRTIKRDATKILSFDRDFTKLTPNLCIEP